MRRATASTRLRVAGLMSALLLIARETVIFETPNSRAMSASVTGIIVLQQCSRESYLPTNILRYKDFQAAEGANYVVFSKPKRDGYSSMDSYRANYAQLQGALIPKAFEVLLKK